MELLDLRPHELGHLLLIWGWHLLVEVVVDHSSLSSRYVESVGHGWDSHAKLSGACGLLVMLTAHAWLLLSSKPTTKCPLNPPWYHFNFSPFLADFSRAWLEHLWVGVDPKDLGPNILFFDRPSYHPSNYVGPMGLDPIEAFVRFWASMLSARLL